EARWLGVLPELGRSARHLSYEPWRRGLYRFTVDAYALAETDLKALAAAEEWAWVDTLVLHRADFRLDRLLASDVLASLVRLELRNAQFRERQAALLASSPNLSRLRELDLGSSYLDERAAAALAGASWLHQLTRLELGYNNIGNAGAEALAA